MARRMLVPCLSNRNALEDRAEEHYSVGRQNEEYTTVDEPHGPFARSEDTTIEQ